VRRGDLTFPTILGTGERLIPAGGPPAYLECLSAGQAGAAVLAQYRRPAPVTGPASLVSPRT